MFIFGCLVLLYNINEQGNQLLRSFEQPGDDRELISTRSGELIKGDIIRGKIESQFPNLGQITVRFNNNFHDSEDVVLFRIGEEGSRGWYYQVKIKTDQFQPHALFPFGFPQIKDSAGKTYIFEIESLNGEQGRGISLDTQQPRFTAKAIYTKSELISDKQLALYFIFHKILSLVNYPSAVLFSFYPFVFFLFLYYFPDRKIQYFSISTGRFITIPHIKHFIFSILIILMILLNIFVSEKIEDVNIIFVLATYLIYSYKYKFESRIALSLVVCLLILALPLLIIGQQVFANSSAVWAYVFLWVTVIQQIGENIFHFHPTVTLEEYLSQYGIYFRLK